jgi:cbb3-type cytochrome oxidase maturation protein
MEVLILTVFVSLTLVVLELIFFAWNLHHGAHEHPERLSLLVLDDELPLSENKTPSPSDRAQP